MQFSGIYECAMTRDIGVARFQRNGNVELYADGDKLSGTMFPTMFWNNAPFTGGTMRDGEFEFCVYFSTPCQQFQMTVKGTAEKDTISGKVYTPMGDYELRGKRIEKSQAYFQ